MSGPRWRKPQSLIRSGSPTACLEDRPSHRTVILCGRFINLVKVQRITRLDHGYLSCIFQGKKTPAVPQLEKIALALGMTMDALLQGIRDRKADLERRKLASAS